MRANSYLLPIFIPTICESNDSQINTSIEPPKSFTLCEADLTESNHPINPFEHEFTEINKTKEYLNNLSEDYNTPCISRSSSIPSCPPINLIDSHKVPSSMIPVRITARDHRSTRNHNSGIFSNRRNLRKIKLGSNASYTLPSLFLSNSRSLVNKIDELSGTVPLLSLDIVVITKLGFPLMSAIQR